MVRNIDDKRQVYDEAFRREAVRLLATSGRTVMEVADDLTIWGSGVRR